MIRPGGSSNLFPPFYHVWYPDFIVSSLILILTTGRNLDDDNSRDAQPQKTEYQAPQSNGEGAWGLPDDGPAALSGWEGQAAPVQDDYGWAQSDQPSSRPEFNKRGGRDNKPDWRELHGIKNENPEDVEQAVDNLVSTLQTVEVKLADKQADVNSPLYSVKSFEQLGLDESLLKGLYAMKFVKPSKVQERALPLLLANPPQNMIAQSQSGTGKTAAFSLTMLSRVDPTLDAVQVFRIWYFSRLFMRTFL